MVCMNLTLSQASKACRILGRIGGDYTGNKIHFKRRRNAGHDLLLLIVHSVSIDL